MDEHKQKFFDCRNCHLAFTRNRVVLGQWFPLEPAKNNVLVLGEAPGRTEDAEGFPFVGESGKILRETWRILAFPRKYSVLLTNTLACRPPQNRVPRPEEQKACVPRLQDLIKNYNFFAIVSIGREAQYYLNNWWRTLGLKNQKRYFVYHPAYVLRGGYSIEAYRKDWSAVQRRLDAWRK